jgi:nucleotidyltransferase/DNA polymerase involved in DNA repair
VSPIFALTSPEPLGAVERRYAAVSLRSAPAVSAVEDSTKAESTDWVDACYRLTPRVERVSARSVILDLGLCTAQKAQIALQELLDHLERHGLHTHAGIGPTPVVAQLGSAMADSPSAMQQSCLISASDVHGFLKHVPIRRLLMLAPADAISVETLARLRRSGIRTLGQLDRLDEDALRRQFGRTGEQLAALAHGTSLHPFQPTPLPATLRFRTRYTTPLGAGEAVQMLPRLAAKMAKTLREQRYEAGTLGVSIHWISGGRTQVSGSLRQRVSEADLLQQELARLIMPALRQGVEHYTDAQIEEIRCLLSDLQRPRPPQALLWPQRRSSLSDRRQRVRELADMLAQRHTRPLLFSGQRIAANTVFSEDGYVLRPFGREARNEPRAAAPLSGKRHREDRDDGSPRLHWW